MSPPFVPVGVDHLVVWIEGLDRARVWYKTVLGCRDGFEYPQIAMTHLWHGPTLIGLWDAADERSKPASATRGQGENVHHVALGWQGATEDAVRAHLQAHNVTVTRELRQVGARGFGLALYFRDPWHNLIELKGPPQYMPEKATGGAPHA